MSPSIPTPEQEAVNLLLRSVPEFATERSSEESYLSQDDNDNSPYLVFGDFARFIIDTIEHKRRDAMVETLIAKSFRVLSEIASSTDDRIRNLAEVGVFEVLTDSPEAILTAREYLSGNASDTFERFVERWAPKLKLSEQ
ncbi:MAG TPA: hypothetical protein VN956_21480 [Pyrinomonadaceae bacterium]|nr:hypothetical protein [Pyrinomonadaceae bacterium]